MTRSAYDHKQVRQPPGLGVVKSLGGFACGPVVLIHTQEFQFQKNQKTHLSVPCSVAIIRLPAPLELTNKLLDGTLKMFAPKTFRIQRDHILPHLRW